MKWHCFLWKKGKVFGNQSFRCWLSWYHCDMCMYVCACVCTSHVQPFMTLWTVACKAPLSMEFSRQEYWSGLPFPTPRDLPDPRKCLLHLCIGRWILYHHTTYTGVYKYIYVCMCEYIEDICIYLYGLLWCFSWYRLCLRCWRPGFDPWVGKISCRRKWLHTPVLLPGEFHAQRSLAGYSPCGPKSWIQLSD